jgi:hypothetical protein
LRPASEWFTPIHSKIFALLEIAFLSIASRIPNILDLISSKPGGIVRTGPIVFETCRPVFLSSTMKTSFFEGPGDVQGK